MHAIFRSMYSAARKPPALLLLALGVLTPVVLVLSIQAKLSLFQAQDFQIRVTRGSLVETALHFLEQRGVEVDGTSPSLRIVRNEEYLAHLHRLAHQRTSPVSIPELPVGPAVFVVEFPGKAGEPRTVAVTPEGRVVSFSLPESAAAGAFQGDAREAALALAQQYATAALRFPDRYRLSDPRLYAMYAESGGPTFRVEWTATHLRAPELSFRLRFTAANGEVVAQDIEADVDDTVVAAAGFAHSFRSILTSIAPLYFVALIFYMLIRYLQRATEKEVSHTRALVVGVYLIAILATVYLAGDAALLLNLQVDGADSLFLQAFAIFTLVVLAFLGGACYAACEGDVREQFPRSLTSFDALLTGRILSRNVARAFLLGFAVACWIFAVQVAVTLQFEGGAGEPGSVLSLYQFVASNTPFLYVFLLMPVGVGMVMLFGYLAPLSVVARLPQGRWLAWIVLGLMSFTNLTILHGGHASAAALFISITVEAIVLLRLIVAADLLTAYVCLVLGSYLTMLTDAQLLTAFPALLQWLMHGIVGVTVLASLALLRWGRQLSDDEVRPAYARALAERQRLSQQLSTAALAQQQLMLRELPAVEGFHLAGDCRPARSVSGDYFDCYVLGRHRVGLFLISGAGRGLLDAMVIAYAKGFLMEHATSSRSPQELMLSLMDALTAVLEPSDRFPELCFLVLDGESRTAAYTRTEGFPELIRVQERSGTIPAVAGGGSAAMVVARTLSGGRSVTLVQGSAPLNESTTFLVYTCGFASSLNLGGVLDVREWLRQQWAQLATTDVQVLLQRLFSMAGSRPRGWQSEAPREDVTLLVARYLGDSPSLKTLPAAAERVS